MKKISCVLLLIFCIQLIAENPCGLMRTRDYEGDWGNGGAYVPANSTIKVFDSNNHEVGTLIREQRHIFFKDLHKVKTQVSATHNVEYIGHYSHLFLRATETHNSDLLEVLMNEKKDTTLNFYIKRNELFTIGGDYCTYQELLLDVNIPTELSQAREWANVGINLSSICLNLRKEPTTSSERIACFGNRGLAGLTRLQSIDSKDKWLKVKLEHCDAKDIDHGDMDEGFCGGCCCKIKDTIFEGWMKAIAEDGFPNIWFSVTSY